MEAVQTITIEQDARHADDCSVALVSLCLQHVGLCTSPWFDQTVLFTFGCFLGCFQIGHRVAVPKSQCSMAFSRWKRESKGPSVSDMTKVEQGVEQG